MGSWQVAYWEEQDEAERQALEFECVAHAFRIEANEHITVHDPLVFPTRTLLRVTGPDGEVWYESGREILYRNIRGQRAEWEAFLAAVEQTANDLLEDDALWPGSADPNHPEWDK